MQCIIESEKIKHCFKYQGKFLEQKTCFYFEITLEKKQHSNLFLQFEEIKALFERFRRSVADSISHANPHSQPFAFWGP